MGCTEAKPENAISIRKVINKIYEINYTDGNTYIGEIKKGMRSGQGEYIKKVLKKNTDNRFFGISIGDKYCKETYKGNWKKDEMSGIGSYKYQDGSVYNGQWKHDMRNGEGEYELSTWGKYKGNWVNNKIEGFGTVHFINGTAYEGNWVNDQMEGQGKMTFPQGFICESEFSKNFVTNKGRFITPSGVHCGVEFIDPIHDFGRLFIKEGHNIPPTYEKFYCICLLFNWSVYEGWMDFGEERAYMALLDSNTGSYNFLSTLKGNGALYNGDKGYINCTWSGKFNFSGFGISCITSKEKYKGMFNDGLRNGYGVCIYSSGDIYKGQWKKDLKDGYGILIYKNGKVFTGDWYNDRKHSGIKTYPNGDSFVGKYKYNKTRQGTYLYNNGERYDGFLKSNKKIDRGIMVYIDGSTYKGQWKDDKPDGFGIFTSNNGWFYQGQWKNGEKSGVGITSDDPYTLYDYSIKENPCVYEPPGKEEYYGGYIEGNLKIGNGKCELANGDVYEGKWESGKKMGKGIYKWANQQRYDGNWEWDKMDGNGVLYMTDGSQYSGNFKEGVYHGKGELIMADGTTIKSEWDKGNICSSNMTIDYNNSDEYCGSIQGLKKHGAGELRSKENTIYLGGFENDLYHGKGKEVLITGEKFTGKWDHGLKQGPGTYHDQFENVYKGTWNMDKKHGEFIITFKTKEVLTITFENDKPVGKGTLDYSGCKEVVNANEESGGILIDNETKQVKWESSTVKEIFKKTKKIKRYENYFYSEPERIASLVAFFKNQVI
ncbi:hypothetical protein SteCoe_37077 [Stentor coeruleus]|uniref:Uncharacterized protein n=1 Tax=Stentor coeruleus TaxID=5963 RepID=A0A1R2AP43_9CILI|nr:hypothetical protein SteCoe_37077 [Stentor coeruleus]